MHLGIISECPLERGPISRNEKLHRDISDRNEDVERATEHFLSFNKFIAREFTLDDLAEETCS